MSLLRKKVFPLVEVGEEEAEDHISFQGAYYDTPASDKLYRSVLRTFTSVTRENIFSQFLYLYDYPENHGLAVRAYASNDLPILYVNVDGVDIATLELTTTPQVFIADLPDGGHNIRLDAQLKSTGSSTIWCQIAANLKLKPYPVTLVPVRDWYWIERYTVGRKLLDYRFYYRLKLAMIGSGQAVVRVGSTSRVIDLSVGMITYEIGETHELDDVVIQLQGEGSYGVVGQVYFTLLLSNVVPLDEVTLCTSRSDVCERRKSSEVFVLYADSIKVSAYRKRIYRVPVYATA